MENIRLGTVLALSLGAWAYQTGPSNTINVHVSSSHYQQCSYLNQVLKVSIDGKQYELAGSVNDVLAFATGDYKARLVKVERKASYEYLQIYEFLFSDGKTRKYYVVGLSE